MKRACGTRYSTSKSHGRVELDEMRPRPRVIESLGKPYCLQVLHLQQKVFVFEVGIALSPTCAAHVDCMFGTVAPSYHLLRSSPFPSHD